MEIIGLAAILPLLAAILKDGFIKENYFLRSIYTLFSFSSEESLIVLITALVLLFIILKNFFGVWVQKEQASFSWNLHEAISSKIFTNAYRRGYLFFINNNSNDILNHVNRVPELFAQQMMPFVFQFLSEFIILCIIIISLLAYDASILILLAIVILPVFYMFYRLTKRKIGDYGRRINELTPLINKPVFEVVFGFVDVTMNGVFSNFRELYQANIEEAKSNRIGLQVVQSIPNRLIETCVILAVLIMLLYGVFRLEESNKIIAMMSVFGLAAYRTIPSVNRIMLAVVNIRSFQFVLEYIENYLGNNDEQKDSESIDFDKSIALDKVCFSYPNSEHLVIDNLDLNIKQGQSIGIMGRSGSGKTTLMNLMLGFLNPTKGGILIDGVRLSSENIHSWQRQCGYVRQDVFLVDGSIKENIAFGEPLNKVDYSKLNEVIEKAKLKELVDTSLEGLDTLIGERGAKLSGGQRQRVGIARALYHGAKILFFDEATSALDRQTEEEVTEAIKGLQDGNLTMIIIAHRESTLRYCDHIIKL